MPFQIGNIVIHKATGTRGVVEKDSKTNKLVVRIHPYIFVELIENDWKLYDKA